MKTRKNRKTISAKLKVKTIPNQSAIIGGKGKDGKDYFVH
jgi:hypothetical protein